MAGGRRHRGALADIGHMAAAPEGVSAGGNVAATLGALALAASWPCSAQFHRAALTAAAKASPSAAFKLFIPS